MSASNEVFGIRLEDKNLWEKRTPLTPEHVAELVKSLGLSAVVQSSSNRAFGDGEYQDAGARTCESLSDCPVVFAVKEIPAEKIERGKTYVYFSHVIKGQRENMPMLQRLLDAKATLIDYEMISDPSGKRLIFFGFHAGLAGMIETLWALGRAFEHEGFQTALEGMRHAYQYPNLCSAREKLIRIGERIEREGFPEDLSPVVIGIAGYGNVSKGAQDILTALPIKEIAPEQLSELDSRSSEASRHCIYKVVFKEEHTVEAKDPHSSFDMKEYFAQPEKYQSRFEPYLPFLSCLVNSIYWTNKNPRLVDLEWVRKAWSQREKPKLRVIGDISCDINGAVQCCTHATDPGDPVYTYIASSGESKQGIHEGGPIMMTVDNLPCELPRESSYSFSEALLPYVPAIVRADYGSPLQELELPEEIKKAIIVHQGEFTKDFEYLREYL